MGISTTTIMDPIATADVAAIVAWAVPRAVEASSISAEWAEAVVGVDPAALAVAGR